MEDGKVLQSSERIGYLPTLENNPDFQSDEYTNLRNASTGVRAALDEFAEASGRIDEKVDPRQYRVGGNLAPKYFQERDRVQSELVAAAEKRLAVLEKIANSEEAEAAKMESSLKPYEAPKGDLASMVVPAFMELKPDQRVAKIHDLARLVGDAKDSDGTAQAYLAALLSQNPHLGLVDERTRTYVTNVLNRTRNATAMVEIERRRHGAKVTKEAIQRARQLMGGKGDISARFIRSE